VPRADGKRDQLQHLLYLAESPNTQRKRARGYRNLAEILLKAGRGAEAMRAYEAAALQGDGPSATVIMRAHSEGRYNPVWLAELLPLVYVPRAQADGTGGPMLMAQLTASGKIKGYGSSGEWLQLAASRGSTQATIKLAEAAEYSGNIKSAAQLYASVDDLSKLDRALRQAKVSLLGDGRKTNSKLALAWLDYAASIDSAAAAKVAGSLWRKEAGSESARGHLLEVALAGGVDPQGGGGGGGYFTRLREAKTDEERTALLVEIKTAADGGNASAALAWAQDGLGRADASLEDEAYAFLAQAVAAGLEPAVTDAAGRLVALDKDSPRVAALLEAMSKAADAGVVAAMWSLADLYAWGGPVAADQDKSLTYMRAAADAGHVEAQLRLGLHFAQRTADPEGPQLARHYLEAAAKQGSAPAEAYLASLKT
jgi:TPR repeat protein